MPIIGLQRRLREVGRLRLGERDRAGYPVKLNRWRFTSPDRLVIDAAAKLYGGTVLGWDSPSGQQWQVTTTATEIACVVPPADLGYSQWYESWTGGGCERRCDGLTEQLSDGPCMCDPSARKCDPTTRVSLMLPGLPGFGLWRLETHGWYAAAELDGTVNIASRAADAGHYIAARLIATERMVKRPGRNGKPETWRFVVPVLDLDLPYGQLTQGDTLAIGGPGAAVAPPTESDTHRPRPLRALGASEPGGSTVAEQVAQLDALRARTREPEMPTIGLAARRADHPSVRSDGNPQSSRLSPAVPTPPKPAKSTPPPDAEKLRRQIMAETKRTWPDLDTDARDDMRHALGIIATAKLREGRGLPPTQSVTDMSIEERLRLSTLMADVRKGAMVVEYGDPTPEGSTTVRSRLKNGRRTAVLVKRAVDDWTVEVTDDEPPEGDDAA
jgi:hypothetical protein